MAAQAAAVQAPARTVGKWDSLTEGASGLENSGVGASHVERALGVAETNRRELVRAGSATGSVSDQTSRLAPGRKIPVQVMFAPARVGQPLRAAVVHGRSW